MKNNQLWFYIF